MKDELTDSLVLIAEDDPDILCILRQYAESAGMRVQTARDGSEALQQYRAGKPDLVLLDINMPKRDGFEVLKALREREATPIIVVSARVEDADKLHGLGLGADDYVVKPFNPREVVASMAAVLRRTRGTRAPEVRRFGGMQVSGRSPREVVSLAESFAHLAESLERMEQNIQYTSASIAHEIRTPLTVLQGYLQGIRDGVFEAGDEQLGIMLRRIDAMGRLIDDLKTLSLAHAGRLRLEIAPTRLRARLREFVGWVQSERSAAWIVFEGAGDPAGDEEIAVAAERIEQVVLGLIHNALHYSGEEGGVAVRYAAREGEVVLTVNDEGPGFSAEALARAGERFWRDESSRSRETGGSGLGLAVARALVEAHGGRLELANRETGGGSVRIHLPTNTEEDL